MKKLIIAVVSALTLAVSPVFAGETIKVAYSHYTGWEPWAYLVESGILKKHADKAGITIQVDLINDYIESINLYTGDKYDAVTVTNMDALTIPALGGVDSSIIIIGDYSNGNDGIVIKNGGDTVADLKGKKIYLAELSVSHYLLVRALDSVGLKERDVDVVATSDADIAAVFASAPNGTAVVTWNPPLMQVRNIPGAKLVYDSSKTPGEIIDCLLVKTSMSATAKQALVDAWYEAMAVMNGKDESAKSAILAMSKAAGGTEAEFRAQLKTTRMFYDPSDAAGLFHAESLKTTMKKVRDFSFDHGLYADGAPDPDIVGIQFADGSVLGDKVNVMLRFDASFTEKVAEKNAESSK